MLIWTEDQDLVLSRLIIKSLRVQVKEDVCQGSYMYTQYLFKDHLTNRPPSPRASVCQSGPDTSSLNPHHPHPDATAAPPASHQHCSKGFSTVAVQLSCSRGNGSHFPLAGNMRFNNFISPAASLFDFCSSNSAVSSSFETHLPLLLFYLAMNPFSSGGGGRVELWAAYSMWVQRELKPNLRNVSEAPRGY